MKKLTTILALTTLAILPFNVQGSPGSSTGAPWTPLSFSAAPPFG